MKAIFNTKMTLIIGCSNDPTMSLKFIDIGTAISSIDGSSKLNWNLHYYHL